MKSQKLKFHDCVRNRRFLTKAQIHMMETISVLFIFFILVFVGMIFYTNIMKSKIREDIDTRQDLKRIQISQIVSSLPELQCSQDNIVTSNCIDLLKLDSASQIISENFEDYFNFFAYSNITVKRIFPDTTGTKEWQLYSNTKDGSRTRTYFPISLYEPINDSYYFGLMTVEVYT